MNANFLTDTIAVGAITGMRSMAGVAAVAARYDSGLRTAVAVMAAGEMVADKTPFVGDRIALLPLLGRACMGALAGGVIARKRHQPLVAGGLIGAMAAVVTAYAAYHARKRLPLSQLFGGLLEDAVVIGISASYVGAGRRS